MRVGVCTHRGGSSQRRLLNRIGGLLLFSIWCLTAMLPGGQVLADDKYFDGGVASTVFGFDYDSGTGGAQTCGQSGCHDEPGGGCLGGSSTN